MATKKKAAAKKKKSVDVNQKKRIRNKVKVGTVEYRSTKQAFEMLGIPLGNHIRFRMKLKAEGKAEIEGHKFTLVQS